MVFDRVVGTQHGQMQQWMREAGQKKTAGDVPYAIHKCQQEHTPCASTSRGYAITKEETL
jgi:hypothetical protein